jgi:hypothetical protein
MQPMDGVFFHVSSSLNRESIARHGLDWRRMEGEFGIAGSTSFEQEGVFLARDRWEADWFVSMGRHRHHTVDIWEVRLEMPDGESQDSRCQEFDGFLCWMEPIPPDRLLLASEDL